MTAPQAAGQRYIGSGPFVSMSEIAAILKERLGEKAKKVPTRKLPDWLVQILGLFDSEVRGQLFDLAKVRRPSSAKAEKELGWSHRPIAETIMDTATSLEAVGSSNWSSRIPVSFGPTRWRSGRMNIFTSRPRSMIAAPSFTMARNCVRSPTVSSRYSSAPGPSGPKRDDARRRAFNDAEFRECATKRGNDGCDRVSPEGGTESRSVTDGGFRGNMSAADRRINARSGLGRSLAPKGGGSGLGAAGASISITQ
jgi:hypothetical protein